MVYSMYMPHIREIESFEYPSNLKGYKPKRRRKNHGIFPALIVIILLGLAFWAISAKAKTIELRDCMTNKCICDLILAGDWQKHTQEDSVISGCAKETI